MNLSRRINQLAHLGTYMQSDADEWVAVKHRAFLQNNWFIPDFINLSVHNIVKAFLSIDNLQDVVEKYKIPQNNPSPKKVGIVMAGNIPLVGFHDLLAVFLCGHYAYVKPSGKDEVLIKHIIEKIVEWEPEAAPYFQIQTLLKNCDAYIATGGQTASTYFEYYFGKYPHILRGNRTSLAILQGNETTGELDALADDVYLYFGLGCRNVTKIFVPRHYDFVPLLDAFKKYDHLAQHNKYKNNYDHNLALHLLNNKYYMTNGSILIIEDPSPFSPISQLNYEYYDNAQDVETLLINNHNIQCVVGKNRIGFGESQRPGMCDFADGVDSFKFLLELK